jgi:hypothetical protein
MPKQNSKPAKSKTRPVKNKAPAQSQTAPAHVTTAHLEGVPYKLTYNLGN